MSILTWNDLTFNIVHMGSGTVAHVVGVVIIIVFILNGICFGEQIIQSCKRLAGLFLDRGTVRRVGCHGVNQTIVYHGRIATGVGAVHAGG